MQSFYLVDAMSNLPLKISLAMFFVLIVHCPFFKLSLWKFWHVKRIIDLFCTYMHANIVIYKPMLTTGLWSHWVSNRPTLWKVVASERNFTRNLQRLQLEVIYNKDQSMIQCSVSVLMQRIQRLLDLGCRKLVCESKGSLEWTNIGKSALEELGQF